MSTLKIMMIGLMAALAVAIQMYIRMVEYTMPVFPLGWLVSGIDYMQIFFHEIGHTLAWLFYGQLALPTFDFEHGGGMTYAFGEHIAFAVLVWGALLYGAYAIRELRYMLIALFLFSFTTYWFDDFKECLVLFMGHFMESLIAAFMLFRGLYNMAPRGDFERFLNIFFGFSFFSSIFIKSSGLLSDEVHRLMYFEQKGSHGIGDFDRIADISGMGFSWAVGIWITFSFICLMFPFVLRLFWTGRYDGV